MKRRWRTISSRIFVAGRAHNSRVERLSAAPDRDNLFVSFGEPVVTLSTHMDTVPPFFPSREDATHIHGRGSV